MSHKTLTGIKIFFILLIAAVLLGGVFAFVIANEVPTGIVTGEVIHRDKEVFKGYVANAKVTLSSEGVLKHTTTDEKGRFKIVDLPTGYYWVHASAKDLINMDYTEVIVQEGKTTKAKPIVMATRQPDIDASLMRSTYPVDHKVNLTLRGYSRKDDAAEISIYPIDGRALLLARNKQNYQQSIWSFADDTPVKKWSVKLKKNDDGFFAQDVQLPSNALGAYLVSAKMGKLQRDNWYIISNIGLITKKSKNKILTYCIDFNTHKPAANVSVNKYSSGELLWSHKTNKDGIITFDDGSDNYSSIIIAEKNGSLASSYASYWNYETTHFCYMYTDRPVYRPGDTVSFKGILREKQKNFYRNAPNINVPIIVRDVSGKTIYNTVTSTNDMGTFNGEFTISKNAPLGTFTIEAAIPNGAGTYAHTAAFSVAEYRKPEFTVSIDFDKKYFVAGTPIKATVQTSYYFGAPVSNAEVTYSVYKSPEYYYYGNSFDDMFYGEFASDYNADVYGYGEYISDGKGKTDANGKLSISIPTQGGQSGNASYKVEVNVTDKSFRTVSASGRVLVPEGLFTISANTEQWIVKPNESAEIAVKAIDHDDNPVANASVYVRIDECIWTHNNVRYKQVDRAKVTTDADGMAVHTFVPAKEGYYRILLEAKDRQKNTIHGEGSIWVAGDEFSESGYKGASLEIVRDKNVYNAGDTARIIINSSVKDVYALLTVEGEDLYYHKVLHLKGNSTLVTLNAYEEYVPNAFISVCFVDGLNFVSNSKSFNVSPDYKLLNVEITSDKDVYKPGDTARYNIKTTNLNGKPVSAEVSLGIVDESIYAILEDGTEDIKKAFYGPKYNKVSTSYSFQDYYLGGADKDGKDEKVRKRFPDTAYWSPNIRTDASGNAVIEMQVPDSLTTWRATARAITADTAVGSSIQKVRATKDLIVRLAAPRFLTQNDSMAVGASLHNYTDKLQRVHLWLETSGLELQGNTDRTVTIGKGEIQRYEWQVQAKEAGKAVITIHADGETESDATETTFTVIPHGINKIETANGYVDGESTISAAIPKNAIPETINLQIKIAPSTAGIMLGSLKYLAEYPYGCVEQTMSRFLPAVIAAETLKNLGRSDGELEKKLPDMVKTGLELLDNYQRPDGGWGWWDDESSPYTTAYVVYGLTHAKRAGYEVDTEMLDRGIASLREQVDRLYKASKQVTPDKAPYTDSTEMIYMLYALSLNGKADMNVVNSILNKRSNMTVYGRSILALTLYEMGAVSSADKVTTEIIKKSTLLNGMRSWKAAEGWGWENSSLEASAYALRAMIRRNPNDPMAEEVIRWLSMKRSNARWNSTKDTAAIIYAISEYLQANSEFANTYYTAEISVNGRQVKQIRVTTDNLWKDEITVTVPSDLLKAGNNKISIKRDGTGKLYYTSILRYFSREENIKPAGSGIKVKREYFTLEPKIMANGEKHLSPVPIKKRVNIGDMILCRLTLDCANEYHYVVIEDPRPAGWESIKQLSDGAMSYYNSGMEEGWVPWTRNEFRDEKTTIFATKLPQGKWKAEYFMRAEVPGEFNSLPAAAYGMYAPQLNGNGAENRIRVR